MCNRYYFAAYSGGECILKFQGTHMTVKTADNHTVVNYIDDDGDQQKVLISINAVWTLEVENHDPITCNACPYMEIPYCPYKEHKHKHMSTSTTCITTSPPDCCTTNCYIETETDGYDTTCTTHS